MDGILCGKEQLVTHDDEFARVEQAIHGLRPVVAGTLGARPAPR
jgi:hypothetical protein